MAPLPQLPHSLLSRLHLSSSLQNIHSHLKRALPPTSHSSDPKNPNYQPGGYSISPTHVNSRAFFALFALLGVAMVLGAIWFFFWARNGGFVFRKGDWEDYKSTVLRRKGPNGTTLSGATKTTKLGGGSVVADEGEEYSEKGGKRWKRGAQNDGGKGKGKKARGNRNNEDTDMRAYRHEKPARVGGLNRQADGVWGKDYAYSATAPSAAHPYSDTASSAPYSDAGDYVPINSPRKGRGGVGGKGGAGGRGGEDGKDAGCGRCEDFTKPSSKKANPETPRKGGRRESLYETPTSNASTDSHRPLRANAAALGGRSGNSTPTKSPRKSNVGGGWAGKGGDRASGISMPGSFTEPLDFESRYSYGAGSEAGTEVSGGTKAYFHPIPGLGKGGNGGNGGRGFRRGGGGGGRRDSLSDSD